MITFISVLVTIVFLLSLIGAVFTLIQLWAEDYKKLFWILLGLIIIPVVFGFNALYDVWVDLLL